MPTGAHYRVPLHRRDRSVAAWAKVDASDAKVVSVFRWHLHTEGYAATKVKGKRVFMHRLLLGCTPGDGIEVDHKNFDCLDNRRDNLRCVTKRENRQNVRGHGTSKHRGVYWDKRNKKWMAYGRTDGVMVSLGRFVDEEEAAKVAREFRLANMPGALA